MGLLWVLWAYALGRESGRQRLQAERQERRGAKAQAKEDWIVNYGQEQEYFTGWDDGYGASELISRVLWFLVLAFATVYSLPKIIALFKVF